MAGSLEARMKPRLWYGWVVLAALFAVMATLIGARNSLGFFFKEMAGEFGWNRAEISAAYSAGMIAQGFTSPLAGWMGDRWNLRWTISAGALATGAALLLGYFIRSLWHLYLMYALLSAGFTMATYVPQVHILSNWFRKRRGLAMGISTSAQGFATVLTLAVPPLFALLGWRASYVALALFVMFIIFPISAGLLRDDPGEKGTVPDAPFLSMDERMALAARRTIPLPMEAPAPPGVWERIFSPRFFLLAGVYGLNAFIFVGTVVHLVPHATDQGFTLREGGVIFLLWGAFIMAGNFASGASDRIGRTPTYLTGAALGAGAAITMGLFEEGTSPAVFYGAAAVTGFANGLIRPTISALAADHFEGPGFGKMNGAVMMIFSAFGAAGAWSTGALYDASGSYLGAFLLMAALFVLGGLLAAALGRMEPARGD
ncbi:MAG: MFS transporter [Nitrospinota bacterium]|jgi:MFS family permease|nr:MFS transporter [Nitrospinota bacterium]